MTEEELVEIEAQFIELRTCSTDEQFLGFAILEMPRLIAEVRRLQVRIEELTEWDLDRDRD